MIRLLMAGLLLVSLNAATATEVTNIFEDGEIIQAEEFNKNFDDLEAAIDNRPAGATGATGVTGAAGAAGARGATGATSANGAADCDFGECLVKSFEVTTPQSPGKSFPTPVVPLTSMKYIFFDTARGSIIFRNSNNEYYEVVVDPPGTVTNPTQNNRLTMIQPFPPTDYPSY